MGRTGERIKLSEDERSTLEKFVSTGKHPAKITRRAQVLLALDTADGHKSLKQIEIAERYGVTRATVTNIKCDFEKGGLERVLARKKRKTPPVPAKADGEFEAHLIALSCTEPPSGYSRWTTRLLADKSIELEYIDSVSHVTVSRILKKTNSSPT